MPYSNGTVYTVLVNVYMYTRLPQSLSRSVTYGVSVSNVANLDRIEGRTSSCATFPRLPLLCACISSVGLHVENATSPFSNSTMVFASVDLGSGAVKPANGSTQCGGQAYAVPGCQGNLPVEAVGTMDGTTFIGQMNHQISTHRLGFPGSLVGTDVASGKLRFNVSFGAPFYTMARSNKTSDVVGLGLCCDASKFPTTCPAKCGASAGPQIGTLAFLRWGADRTQPPAILKTFTSAVLGLKFVAATGGALNDELDIYTHLGLLKKLNSTSDANIWGGVNKSPPPPHHQLQAQRGAELALFNFDAHTGALLSKVALQGSPQVVKEDLFFLRYV